MPKSTKSADGHAVPAVKAFEKMARPKLEVAPFIASTYNMLQNKDAFVDVYDTNEADGKSDNSKYVRWSENGKALLIADEVGFSTKILPKYFKHKNISSFIRQLNIYGFHKTKQDPQFKEFCNDDFQRGKPHLLSNISRRTNRSKGSKEAQLQKILRAQKGLKDEEKVEFKKLLAEVKYIKAQAQNVTSRLKQVETENKALREQNNQMLRQQQSIIRAEGRMRKMIQFMYMMQKQQEKNMALANRDDKDNYKMLKNSSSFKVMDRPARAVGRTNSLTFNEMIDKRAHNVADGMFDSPDGLEPITKPVRQTSSTSNIDTEMLAELFPDSPSASKISSRDKGRSLSRGNSFVVGSSGKEKGSSSTLGKRTKALSSSPTDNFFASAADNSKGSSQKKRKVGDRQQNLDSEIARLASSTSDYYTRLGSFEESLGRSYGSTDMDSLLSTPMFDANVLEDEAIAQIVD